jgi:four helix bundle protein
LFECVACLDLLKDENLILEEKYNALLDLSDEISRLLYAMIKNLTQ